MMLRKTKRATEGVWRAKYYRYIIKRTNAQGTWHQHHSRGFDMKGLRCLYSRIGGMEGGERSRGAKREASRLMIWGVQGGNGLPDTRTYQILLGPSYTGVTAPAFSGGSPQIS